MYSTLKRGFGLTAAVFIVAACADEDDLTGAKCRTTKCSSACWDCGETEGDPESTEAFQYSAQDVVSRMVGKWTGDAISIEVHQREGELVRHLGPIARSAGCNIPMSATLMCAGMIVPVDVTVETDKGDESWSINVTSAQVRGYELSDADTVPKLDAYKGFPTVGADTHVDGMEWDVTVAFGEERLWLSEEGKMFRLAAEKER